MQNRELSWLTFNERVLEQGTDPTVPLLDRLNFVSIFWSNLQEFFMIRVGSLTDLNLVKKRIVDNKTNMTPSQQLDAIYARCHELYPVQEQIFNEVKSLLDAEGIHHLAVEDLSAEQKTFLKKYLSDNVMPFLAPQIVNILHPFPHLENGKLYIIVRLNQLSPKKNKTNPKAEDGVVNEVPEDVDDEAKSEKAEKKGKEPKKIKDLGAEGATIGIIPLPHHHERVIKLPGDGFSFILLENALEMIASDVFSMYDVKHTNTICVTRNADLDASEGLDEIDEDYREHMKRILKKRSRLAPVRLESRRPLSETAASFLHKRLGLKAHQTFTTPVPLDLSYTFSLGAYLGEAQRDSLTYPPLTPQWPAQISRNRPVIDQVQEREILLSYPYECMDPFIQLLREAANDPSVISIKISLYRLANQSHLAEALISAAENGKEVTALFELRARFDESNNIEWSQRFEQAGAKVLYGFRDYKVHAKICCITRQTEEGVQYITQLGTGNYNEKTAKLYTDFSFITTDESFGRDAVKYFRNMGLENVSDDYDIIAVAPLQIKPAVIDSIDKEIEKARRGEPCGLYFKTNSVTDKDVIMKLSEASQAGVPVILFVRGICCLVPGVPGHTERVRVLSVVGRLLEHSRIFGFGPLDSMKLYLSSADLMTRNMERRVEIAWPVLNQDLRREIIDYIKLMLKDTAKLRELKPDGSYTPLGSFAAIDDEGNKELFDAQDFLVKDAQKRRQIAAEEEAEREANRVRREKQEVLEQEDASIDVVATPIEAIIVSDQGNPPRKAGFFARLRKRFRR